MVISVVVSKWGSYYENVAPIRKMYFPNLVKKKINLDKSCIFMIMVVINPFSCILQTLHKNYYYFRILNVIDIEEDPFRTELFSYFLFFFHRKKSHKKE